MGQGNKANKQKFHHTFGTKSSLGKAKLKDIFWEILLKDKTDLGTKPGKLELAGCPWAMWLMKSLQYEG